MHLKGTGYIGMCWIYMVLGNIQRRVFVKSAINRRFSKKEGKFVMSLTAISFLRQALLHINTVGPKYRRPEFNVSLTVHHNDVIT
jgi:hypothetical protein